MLLCGYSPADGADYAEEYSMAVLFRRERQIGVGVALRSGDLVCVNLRETYCFSLVIA